MPQAKPQNRFQNGMHGVFLTAAELTYRGFIVSLTSRNAYGADLLVTDGKCQRTWSVQVKTNQSNSSNYWLLSPHCKELAFATHVYVFVALNGDQRPRFIAVPSRVVAESSESQETKAGRWYWFSRNTPWNHEGEGWEEAFGVPAPNPASTADLIAMEVQAETLDSTRNEIAPGSIHSSQSDGE
jgi:hypothetical protein